MALGQNLEMEEIYRETNGRGGEARVDVPLIRRGGVF